MPFDESDKQEYQYLCAQLVYEETSEKVRALTGKDPSVSRSRYIDGLRRRIDQLERRRIA